MKDIDKDGFVKDCVVAFDELIKEKEDKIRQQERQKVIEEVFNKIERSDVDHLGNCGCINKLRKIKERLEQPKEADE